MNLNIMCLGILLNLQVRKPYNLVLINLAIVEFILAAIGLPLDIFALVKKGWILGKNICIISGSLVTTAGTLYTTVELVSLTILKVSKLDIRSLYLVNFRICFNADSLHSVSLSNEKLSLWRSNNRKSLFIFQRSEINSYDLGSCIHLIFASTNWLGQIHSRNFWAWVSTFDEQPIITSPNIIECFDVSFQQFSYLLFYFSRCAPDWHSEKLNIYYIIWIMTFGFLIPTLLIIMTSMVLYCNLRSVSNNSISYSCCFKSNYHRTEMINDF